MVDFTVEGQGGNDTITVSGSVVANGRVFGGAGDDTITGPDGDLVTVGGHTATVDGGNGTVNS
ncbi:hypothetical protein [Streptomyces sp. Ag109_G2-15]|uniref:hypothetical protein n=1 Tax=Streptomyces sp. Ag109_G2-15 TaxID=1938850 RepID=UPI000BE31508|nr:hypothetical protein [Streptomyces sp. Ag109_G2-15]